MSLKTYQFVAALTCFILYYCATCTAQTWKQKSNVPGGNRLGAFSFVIGDTVYVGGGEKTDMWGYNTTNDTWAPKAGLTGITNDRTFAVSFTLNGKGYLGGGADGSYHSGAIDKDDLWEYNPATDTWTQKNNLPSPDQRGVFVLNNTPYLLCLKNYKPALFQYDAVNDTWIPKKEHPGHHLYNPFVFAVNNKGYIACGNDSTAGTKKTYEYDPVADSWAQKADLPADAREAGVAFTLHNKGYIAFGANYIFSNYYNDLFMYDPANDKWSHAGVFPAAERSYAVAAVVNNKAYIGSGWSFTSSDNYYHEWYELSVPSGVSRIPEKEIKIYPNPATDILHVDGISGYNYSIATMDGRKVSGGAVTGKDIGVGQLSQGHYILQIMSSGWQYHAIINVTR